MDILSDWDAMVQLQRVQASKINAIAGMTFLFFFESISPVNLYFTSPYIFLHISILRMNSPLARAATTGKPLPFQFIFREALLVHPQCDGEPTVIL
jgi:hypothetical protein